MAMQAADDIEMIFGPESPGAFVGPASHRLSSLPVTVFILRLVK
jgi:hypothetical protein